MMLKKFIKKLLTKIVGINTPSVSPPIPPQEVSQLRCTVCDLSSAHFEPISPAYIGALHKAEHEHNIFLYETLNLQHYNCPKCGATDRDRLIALYFNNLKPNNKQTPPRIAHFAPSKPLNSFLLKKYGETRVSTADLYMEGVDNTLDITSMPEYSDSMFDTVICSHVLEHVEDDEKAVREICRILEPNGIAVLLAPIHLTLSETIENKTNTCEIYRWRRFGQGDHLRLYSKAGFIRIIEKAGFELETLDVNHFSEDTFVKHGIFKSSALYVARKPLTNSLSKTRTDPQKPFSN